MCFYFLLTEVVVIGPLVVTVDAAPVFPPLWIPDRVSMSATFLCDVHGNRRRHPTVIRVSSRESLGRKTRKLALLFDILNECCNVTQPLEGPEM